jgi:hypothetical protein
MFGKQIWQSNEGHREDSHDLRGPQVLLKTIEANSQDDLDEPDGPPEPVAQVRVLPGAPRILAAQKWF